MVSWIVITINSADLLQALREDPDFVLQVVDRRARVAISFALCGVIVFVHLLTLCQASPVGLIYVPPVGVLHAVHLYDSQSGTDVQAALVEKIAIKFAHPNLWMDKYHAS